MASTDYPPSPNFTGIDFNPDFFPSTASEYVEFPVAQGTETFGTIYTTKVDTPTPSTDFDLLTSETANINIGTSVATTKVITLGSSASSTILKGTNVTVTKLTTPAIDSTSASTNMTIGDNLRGGNLTLGGSSGHTGTINLGAGQTSGAINIGTGPRTSGGNVSILTAASSGANVQVLIGTAVNSNTVLYGSNVLVDTKMQTPVIEAKAAATGMTIGSNITSGTITIGGTAQAGNVDIDTTSTGAHTITIGTAGSTTTSLKGLSVDVGTKITTPILNATAIDTAMTIGANLTTGSLTIGGTTQTGDISLGAGQTSGDLFIGTASRTSAADINIGTGANLAGNIFIGHKLAVASTQLVKINTSTAASAGATTIGSSSSATTIGGSLTVTGSLVADGGISLPSGDILTLTGNINGAGNITTTGTGAITSAGLLTASGGFSMSGNNSITLGAPTTNPTSSQLGYFVTVSGTSGVSYTTTSVAAVTSTNLPIGVYMVTYSALYTNWSAGAANVLTHTTTATNVTVGMLLPNTVGTSTSTGDNISGYIRTTSATNTFAINVATSNGTVLGTTPTLYIVRVA